MKVGAVTPFLFGGSLDGCHFEPSLVVSSIFIKGALGFPVLNIFELECFVIDRRLLNG